MMLNDSRIVDELANYLYTNTLLEYFNLLHAVPCELTSCRAVSFLTIVTTILACHNIF